MQTLLIRCFLVALVLVGACIAERVSSESDSSASESSVANTQATASGNVAAASGAHFKVMKREIWGRNLEATLELDVVVLTVNPSMAALQRVARDAGEVAYHSHGANSAIPVCNLMVRLHNEVSEAPNDDVAAYGTARPMHAPFSCLDKVPELWEWEYHTFPNR